MKKRLSENAKNWVGRGVNIKWGVSRGQASYGYTTVALRDDRDKKWAACNGGGYDMRGTVVGSWIAQAFASDLCKIKETDMPENSYWKPDDTLLCPACKDAGYEKYLEALRDCDDACLETLSKKYKAPRYSKDIEKCPVCGVGLVSSRDGETIQSGHSFYGLCFADPNYDPGKALVGKDCDDRTMGQGSEGKTVEEAEAAGESLGLERYQAFYKETSKFATKRHTVPCLDGACGLSCMLDVFKAIGLGLHKVASASKLDVYTIVKL